jgi:hypothetical protein
MVVLKVFAVSISLVYNLSARLDCLKKYRKPRIHVGIGLTCICGPSAT